MTELLDDSCDRLKLRDIKDSLLDIMKKFNLLCEYTSKEGSSIYLVPCMLTLSPDELKLNISGNPKNPAPVYITFNTKYVPAGLFCRLLVLFMEYAQRIHSDQPELSANYAHFFIGEFTGIKFVATNV
ncbi:Glycosyl transferases group 1 [Desmophyllum pertusum]|uniref:Glycosyl transferases group 1 n=1 Tax=Desmophyllum pertusum TaxID=174260 RepID=A0A9W9YYU7_9CNID|nr:Glycosyl transferases group 1 [Desmophyllum pertusum]